MAEKKRKTRDEFKHKKEGGRKQLKSNTLNQEKNTKKNKTGERRKRTGLRLPTALRKELDLINPTIPSNSVEEEIDSDDANHVYEYEEAIPEEEYKKNRRFDPVDNFEYELPRQFEDENVASDDAEEEDIVNFTVENHKGDEVEEEDEVMQGCCKKSLDCPVMLLEVRRGKMLSSYLRNIQSLNIILVVMFWMVMATLAFRTFWTVPSSWKVWFQPGIFHCGGIASELEPRPNFEKKIASLVNDNEVVEAHKKDRARLVELNKIYIEDVKDRQNRLAKMCSLRFHDEMKAKRIKKYQAEER
ncbi:hypothetical protein F0562_000834 [Nyssa sinensis]|uniref:Uncharacterized protein n=1 Tax=Nyssa sinensis TaxID=561372 RepID=A0A5J5C4Y5_9ASTE|nr:hypothetical protein F0562_000834 [Nyssa sinensis]